MNTQELDTELSRIQEDRDIAIDRVLRLRHEAHRRVAYLRQYLAKHEAVAASLDRFIDDAPLADDGPTTTDALRAVRG